MSIKVDATMWPGPVPTTVRYPWEAWTDGGVWEIYRFVDFHVTVDAMQSMIHQRATVVERASGRPLHARTCRVNSDQHGEGIRLQFYVGPPRPPKADNSG